LQSSSPSVLISLCCHLSSLNKNLGLNFCIDKFIRIALSRFVLRVIKQPGDFSQIWTMRFYLHWIVFVSATPCRLLFWISFSLDWVQNFSFHAFIHVPCSFISWKELKAYSSSLLFAGYMVSSLERCWKNLEVILPMWIMPSSLLTVAVSLQLPVIVLLRCWSSCLIFTVQVSIVRQFTAIFIHLLFLIVGLGY